MTPFDPGLQPERTALAWRRTALSLAVGALAAGRMLEPLLGRVAWMVAAVGVALGFGLLLVARRRAALVGRALATTGDLEAGPGAALLVGVTAVAVLAGVAGLVVVGI